jgi:hypothetical protein
MDWASEGIWWCVKLCYACQFYTICQATRNFILNKKYHFLLLVAFLFSITAYALPAEVIIIRHAEKPPVGNQLSARGMERAVALAPYFLNTAALLKFGTPVAIYAQRPNSVDSSLRPIQTCTPVANALHLPVNTTYSHDQYAKMAQAILQNPSYDHKTVLICWEHHVIPALAYSFGVKPQPPRWHNTVFDRTWVIYYNKNSSIASFQNLPQRLLYGDSTS